MAMGTPAVWPFSCTSDFILLSPGVQIRNKRCQLWPWQGGSVVGASSPFIPLHPLGRKGMSGKRSLFLYFSLPSSLPLSLKANHWVRIKKLIIITIKKRKAVTSYGAPLLPFPDGLILYGSDVLPAPPLPHGGDHASLSFECPSC